MDSRLPKDRTLEMEDRWKIKKNIAHPSRMQKQQDSPAPEATQRHRPAQPPRQTEL